MDWFSYYTVVNLILSYVMDWFSSSYIVNGNVVLLSIYIGTPTKKKSTSYPLQLFLKSYF